MRKYGFSLIRIFQCKDRNDSVLIRESTGQWKPAFSQLLCSIIFMSKYLRDSYSRHEGCVCVWDGGRWKHLFILSFPDRARQVLNGSFTLFIFHKICSQWQLYSGINPIYRRSEKIDSLSRTFLACKYFSET